MAQLTAVNKQLLSLLKINDEGWNTTLFEDESIVKSSKCKNCGGVCCDAVELGCDHDDDQIYLYCKQCLLNVIKSNNDKCPINYHLNPTITPNRAIRRQISKATINCPYSIKYIQQQYNIDDNNNSKTIIHSISDEKEGIVDAKNCITSHIKGCDWNGTLNELLNNNHLNECVEQYNPSFIQNIYIKQLQHEIKRLNEIIDDDKNRMNEQEVIINALKDENNTLKSNISIYQNNQQNNLQEIDKLKTEVFALKNSNNDLKKMDDLELKNNDKDEEIERFDTMLCGSNITLCGDDMIMHTKNAKNDFYHTVYGKMIIPSSRNKTYIWKFECLGNTTNGVCIGIDNAEGRWIEQDFRFKKEKACYGYDCYMGWMYSWNCNKQRKLPQYLFQCDILTMTLKFSSTLFGTNNDGILSYKINDESEFIANTNIKRDRKLKYRLAISAAKYNGYKFVSLKLVQFNIVSRT